MMSTRSLGAAVLFNKVHTCPQPVLHTHRERVPHLDVQKYVCMWMVDE